ncbi:MFS transporter [Zavarzinia sp.]|uniref:MFS transporter n=1 Tax=Zavarzinia sp. TaxID=2027920 RepID=UPI003561A48E
MPPHETTLYPRSAKIEVTEMTMDRHEPRGAMAALAPAMLLSSLGTSIANIALPALAADFRAPFGPVQWVVLAYLLAITVTIVGAGRAGDLFGRRRVLLLGLGGFVLTSVLCGLAPSLGLLIAARALQGICGAALMAMTVALVRESVPEARTGAAMGLLGTMSAIGTALGPSLGGLLLAGPGWRAVFLVMVPVGLPALLLAWRRLPKDGARPAAAAGFDAPGAVLLGLTLAAAALAATLDGAGWPAALAPVGLAAFLMVERRVPAPLVPPAVFRDRALTVGLVANVAVSAAIMATLLIGPFTLARGLGLGSAAVGAVLSIGPAISIVSGVPAGRLVDRLGAPAVVRLGLGAMAVGALALGLLPGIAGIPGYILGIAVLTPGYQLFQAANNTAVVAGAGPARRGVVAGLLSLSRNLGLIAGTAVLGTVFAAVAGDTASAAPGAILAGFRLAFGLASILLLAALGLTLAGRRRPEPACPGGGDPLLLPVEENGIEKR